jgi:elongation factor 1-beta
MAPVNRMGEVLLKYRVMPEGTEVDLNQLRDDLEAALPAFAKLQTAQPRPFAFGLSALVTAIVVQDEEGNNDKLEQILMELPGVQGVELLDMGRL